MPTKKVLFATDYSPDSQMTLAYAASMARERGATLLVMHALELEKLPVGELFDEDPKPPSNEVQKLAEVKPRGIDVPVEHRLVFCAPARADEAICKLAREEDAMLIVIGARGATAGDEQAVGGVARRVINNAPCPVVTVRHR